MYSPTEGGTWGESPKVLPTATGMSTGVVEAHPKGMSGKSRTKVQCAVCLRTYTDETFWAVKQMNFAPDEGERGWVKYRRCQACQKARLHPKGEDHVR